MNIGAISALIIAVAVFFYGLILSGGDSLKIFYDFPSIFIVFGGVFAATAISFQYKRMFIMCKAAMMRLIKGKSVNFAEVIKEVIQAVDKYRKGESLKSIADNTNDFFFKEGLQMLDGGILSPDQVTQMMEERNDNLFYLYSEDASKLKIVGKYPPAFGMMGTTMGMIVLLANLNGADAIKRVGPAMGICLITTLYGTVVANFGFLPIADNLVEQAKETYLKNRILVEGLKQMVLKENPIVVAEKLNSYLHPGDRLDWKTVLGSK
ncbi:MAG TPA: MotA/TolQ/ExbB proton channel family protein [Bacteriovoracaceae bacterium]|nr:MotA/TolQ/ExbB proton channel family protein [Bacteriovoracaceae bacterium]